MSKTPFTNRDCPYFPCHETADPAHFNCLFCYCPLYALGEACGGAFRYTADGIKDCSACLLPHTMGGYDHVLEGCTELIRRVRKKEASQS